MRKIFIALVAVMLSTQAFAQFEKGKNYVAGSLTGLGLSYTGNGTWTFGLQGMYGRFVADSWMLVGSLNYQHVGNLDGVSVGGGARYYIVQNGLHVGGNLLYTHHFGGGNSVHLGPELGYTFFLNRNVTIEPAVYCNFSLNDFKNGTQVGLRIGFGYFF